MNVKNKIDELYKEHPHFHNYDKDWSIDREIIDWICNNTHEGYNTLETGCGYSTIAFILSKANHTVISPSEQEHLNIINWCNNHSIDLSKTTFVKERSQDVIHSLSNTPLDIVLIDGCHSFPVTFLDWYYASNRLKKNGHVIVDDIQIITGELLDNFLRAEKNRWELEKVTKVTVGDNTFDKTVIYRSIKDNVNNYVWWGEQQYCYPISK